jgi:hypothetical protein
MQSAEQNLSETFYIRELKTRLEARTSLTIKEFSDCKKMSAILFQNGIAISAHTFARFFGLIKSNHRPYTTTLNLICIYLGFDSFNAFCRNIKNEFNDALHGPLDLFHSGRYSLIALELSIANNDWNSMKEILESVDKEKFLYQDLVIALGNAVRAHPMQEQLLRELNTIDNGRWLFYECYVDEDDRNGYYSNALRNYYQFSDLKPSNVLFLECFLASKAIYSRKSDDLSKLDLIGIKSFPIQELHFHEISRLFEIRLLLDYLNQVLPEKLLQHLDNICLTCNRYVHYDACWIIARSIKALAFAGQLKKAMTYAPFYQTVLEQFQACVNKIESIAELIIQFVGHSFFIKNKKVEAYFPPSKIAVKHDNETNARILIEAATANLYAQDSVKTTLERNIHSFASLTGQTWIFELLD